MVLLSFSIFLLIFILIGLASSLKSQKNSSDYLLAGRNTPPWLVALSAVATANSGYMFIGMIGYTYAVGLSSMWLLVGWILGDFLASFLVHKKVRTVSEKENILSFGGLLSKWYGQNHQNLRALAGFFTILFLGTYAAAQLSAGSKALHVLLQVDYQVGAIIGAVMVLLYCFAGGIRASIWTDAAQSCVMMAAMVLLVFTATNNFGGLSGAITQLTLIPDGYLSLWPQENFFGPILGPVSFLLGWLFAGFGVVGQPHIMVRFMAMDNIKNFNKVRFYYFSWYSLFAALTVMVGLLAKLMIINQNNFDAELALPMMATKILPEALVGLILAGLFSATMSTADSQILSCTAAIARDFFPNKKLSFLKTKLATIFITLLALGIALFASSSVFTLVVMAWAALASLFAPLLFVLALGARPKENVAIAMMLMGLLAMLSWRHFGLSDHVYEVLPGMLAGFFIFGLSPLFSKVGAKDEAKESVT